MRVIGGEDEDGRAHWDKVPSYEKRTNFIIMHPDGSGDRVTIPVPFVYNWFQTLGQEMGAMMNGNRKPWEAVAEIGSAAVDSFNPLGGAFEPDPAGIAEFAFPTVTEPLIQLIANRDFAGRPIEPTKFDKTKPDSANFFSGASETSKAITAWLNRATGGDEFEAGSIDISPETLDHLSKFLGSGAGATLGRVFDLGLKANDPEEEVTPRDIPIIRRLYREPSTFASQSDFKELRSRLNAERKRQEAQGGTASASLRSMRSEASRIEKERRRAMDRADALKGEPRRRVIEQLDRKIQRFNLRMRKYLLRD